MRAERSYARHTRKAIVGRPDRPARAATIARPLFRRPAVVAALDQSLREPEPSQNLERARLDGERAQLVYAIELPVDDPDASAVCMQLGGKRQTGRTRRRRRARPARWLEARVVMPRPGRLQRWDEYPAFGASC